MLLTISLVYMPLYLVESVGKEEEFIATVPLVSYIGSLVASLLMRQFRTLFHTKVSSPVTRRFTLDSLTDCLFYYSFTFYFCHITNFKFFRLITSWVLYWVLSQAFGLVWDLNITKNFSDLPPYSVIFFVPKVIKHISNEKARSGKELFLTAHHGLVFFRCR